MRKSLAAALLLIARFSWAETETLDFSQAIARAVERNPSAEAARADVHRAEALLAQARAGYLPSVNLNSTLTQLDGDRKVGDRVLAPSTSINANVQAVVPILAMGRRAQAARVEDSVAVSKAAADDVARQVALATARAFVAVVTQHRLVEVATSSVAVAKEHEAFARDRYEGGVGNQADVLRALQEVAASESQLAQARGALARAQEALGTLVGSDGPVDAAQVPTLSPPAKLDDALDEARGKRTDLAAAGTRVRTAERTLDDAWMDQVPNVSLNVQPFVQNPATVTQPTLGVQAQLVLTLPLWDSGLRKAQQEERAALAEQARAQLATLERNANGEVRVAFSALRHADDALAAARRSSEAARKMLELSSAAFKVGAASGLEVVDAEQRVRAAEVSVAVAEDQSRQARVELLIACGRLP
jgi:outer membrane protein TolC